MGAFDLWNCVYSIIAIFQCSFFITFTVRKNKVFKFNGLGTSMCRYMHEHARNLITTYLTIGSFQSAHSSDPKYYFYKL